MNRITKLLLILLSVCFLTCNERSNNKKTNHKKSCISDLSYDPRDKTFNPALIKITIINPDTVISSGVKSGALKDILFYAIPKDPRFYFKKTEYFEIKNDTIVLGVLTNYFKADTVRKWNPRDVETKLKKEVGLVINNDTIYIKRCN